jgi:hypothetical protein
MLTTTVFLMTKNVRFCCPTPSGAEPATIRFIKLHHPFRAQAEVVVVPVQHREAAVVVVPVQHREAPVEGIFKEETMRSLSDLGRTLGATPEAWHTEAP